MASDQAEFLKKIFHNQEKQARRAQHAACKARKAVDEARALQLQRMAIMKALSKSHATGRRTKSSAHKSSKSNNSSEIPIIMPTKNQDINALHQNSEFSAYPIVIVVPTARFPSDAQHIRSLKECPTRNCPMTMPQTRKTSMHHANMHSPNVTKTAHPNVHLPRTTGSKATLNTPPWATMKVKTSPRTAMTLRKTNLEANQPAISALCRKGRPFRYFLM
jgi:hypothetical protein